LAEEFGLNEEEIKEGLKTMLIGSVELLFKSEFSAEEVLDLIPVYPLKNSEETIRNFYDTKLTTLYQKLLEARK